jgi:perosamine synthetase
MEDAAEAHFARYKGRPTGGLGDLGTFSFYGNKIITCGEGGAVNVNNKHLELRLRTLRGQGMDPQRRYYFPVTGYNFRLTNLAAAILCSQLDRREEIVAGRSRIFSVYENLLAGIPGIRFQPVAPWAEKAPWLFCLTVEAKEYGRSRDDLVSLLSEKGIETRPFFMPLHKLPPFRQESVNRGEILPHTDSLSESGMNLPTFSALTDSQLNFIADAIRQEHR